MEDKDKNNKNEKKEIIELNNIRYRILYYLDQGSFGKVYIVEGINDKKNTQ